MRFINAHCLAQRLLTDGLLVIGIKIPAHGQHQYAKYRQTKLQQLIAMTDGVFNRVADLFDKLIVLQFSAMRSVHGEYLRNLHVSKTLEMSEPGGHLRVARVREGLTSDTICGMSEPGRCFWTRWLILAVAAACFAQVDTATITGTVTDPSGGW